MIQSSELRNGNLLNRSRKRTHPQTTLPDELVEVATVQEDAISYSYPNLDNRVEPFEDEQAEFSSERIPFTELAPVPLTPEWLLKAGVEVHDGVAVVQSLAFRWSGETLQAEDGTGETLRYVHQLQNAYEDQTGAKLNIDFNMK